MFTKLYIRSWVSNFFLRENFIEKIFVIFSNSLTNFLRMKYISLKMNSEKLKSPGKKKQGKFSQDAFKQAVKPTASIQVQYLVNDDLYSIIITICIREQFVISIIFCCFFLKHIFCVIFIM